MNLTNPLPLCNSGRHSLIRAGNKKPKDQRLAGLPLGFPSTSRYNLQWHPQIVKPFVGLFFLTTFRAIKRRLNTLKANGETHSPLRGQVAYPSSSDAPPGSESKAANSPLPRLFGACHITPLRALRASPLSPPHSKPSTPLCVAYSASGSSSLPTGDTLQSITVSPLPTSLRTTRLRRAYLTETDTTPNCEQQKAFLNGR